MAQYGLRDEILDFIVESAKRFNLKKVILYGSRAKTLVPGTSVMTCITDVPGTLTFEERCPTLLSFDFIDLSDDLSDSLARRIQDEGAVLYGEV